MQLIKESKKFQRNLDIYSYILNQLKIQNPDIENVEDIILDIIDSWESRIVFGYELHNSVDDTWMDFSSREFMDYMGMVEADFDSPDSDYRHNNQYLSKIRSGEYENLTLKIHCQYPSEVNGWEPIEITPERKQVISDVEERLKSLNSSMEFKYSNGIRRKIDNGIWHIKVLVPVKLKLDNRISLLDGVSNKFIKDFDSFISDYKIDHIGVDRLSDIIRRK